MPLTASNMPRIFIKLKTCDNTVSIKRYFNVSLITRHQLDEHQPNYNNKKEKQEKNQLTISNYNLFFSTALNTKLKLNDLYENLVLLEDVQMTQNKVIETKDKLLEAHNIRIRASTDLFNTQQEIEGILKEISTLNKLDLKNIELYQKLEDLQRIENEHLHNFKSYDEKERLLLTCFISSMLSAIEKQDIYRISVSFWYKIFAVLWALLTVGASIVGYRYNSQIPHVVVSLQELRKEIQQKPEGWGAYISRHSSNVYRYFIPKRN